MAKNVILPETPMGSMENLRRMATVIQDSNDAITFQDLEGNILAWNRGAEIIYGYTQSEALKMNIVDTVPKEYQEEARGFLASLKRGELLPNLETKRKNKDGRIIDVWLTNTKLTDDKGNLTGLATTERDITERNQTEASLREKFRELEYLREGQIALSERMRGEQIISDLGQSILSHLVPFTNSQVGAFYFVTEAQKLQRVSTYALPKTGSSERLITFGEGLVGQVAIEKTPLLIENVPPTYFSKIKSDLGEMIPRSLLIVPVLYEDDVYGVIELGSLHPYTEHQLAFLGHVSENIGIAINTSGVRKKVEQLLTQSQKLNEELEEQSRALKESQTRLVAQQTELEETNSQLEKQSIALKQQQEILNERNEALNKAQVLLEEKATEVQRASQYKTEFLANMSHELRTPLNSSSILAKLLMDNAKGNLTEEQTQFARSIYSSGNDLLNIINDILDLSKVEAGKLDIRVENVFIPKVMESLQQTFGTLAKEKELTFSISNDASISQAILTDRQRLEQILKNLISNAIKFTEKGSVMVRLYPYSKGFVAFEVSDSGIGIPKEQQEIIFEAFRQADGTTNRKFGGTGLGLSISKDLAKLLGGSIKVDSAAGQGSRFTLILPESMSEPILVSTVTKRTFDLVAAVPFKDDRLEITATSKTILIIEDDIVFLKTLFDLAHGMDFKCIVAQSANEGFDLAKEYEPDAILLDVMLPDHVGLTVLDRLKEDLTMRHIPVCVMSSEDHRETALFMGAIGFMLKPANQKDILQSFNELEEKFSQKLSRVLIVEGDEIQRKNITDLISDPRMEITTVSHGREGLEALRTITFDCMIMDINLKDMSSEELLVQMNKEDTSKFPPVIVYSTKTLSEKEKEGLHRFSRSLVLKGAKTPERLLNEVTLILHRAHAQMAPTQVKILKGLRNREQVFEGRKILLVDDDIRNIFALTSALEQKGATIIVGRNGHEALERLDEDPTIDLVLMDIMMPEMDGYEASRQIRKQARFQALPIIAVTAKAMKDDLQKCIEAGANDYLSKPVDLDKLLSLIRVWIPKFGKF